MKWLLLLSRTGHIKLKEMVSTIL